MSGIKRNIKNYLVEQSEKSGVWKKIFQKCLYIKRRHDCRKYRKLPINEKLIVMECYQGRQYSCSPKALFLAMQKDERFNDFTFAWMYNDKLKYRFLRGNPRTRVIERNCPEYFKLCMTAKYIITNSTWPAYMDVRPEQVYIQTWHGTPLKKLGFDISKTGNKAQSLKQIKKQYKREQEHITYLLSPSEYASEKLASAFGMNEEEKKRKIIEEGYPRNDILFKYTEEYVDAVKKRLKLPMDKKFILYAPTFRDDAFKDGKGFYYELQLDIDKMRKHFGNEYCLLVRSHYLAKMSLNYEAYKGFLFGVSHVNDINDLYIISDLLITDYSSVMFDYAILKRPMIFYMYDYEKYKNVLRDFYLDTDILPGRIVYNEDELIDAVEYELKNFSYDEKYRMFNERFNPKDDADSSKRVLDYIMRDMNF